MRILYLASHMRDEIIAAAQEAFPRECCGMIEGVAVEDGWRVLAIHPARNVADDPERKFLIDPQTHFELLRALRGTDRRIIGCFHSHPNGRAIPSAADRAGAIEPDFVWLVAAGTRESGFVLGAYLFAEQERDFVPLTLHD